MEQRLSFNAFAQELWRFRFVVYTYVQTTLRLRYRRSYLGFIWTVLAPLAQYAVVGVMMQVLLRGRTVPNFYGHYFLGAVFFAFVSAILARGPNLLIGNEHFIKKIYLPKIIFVINAVCYEAANFFLAFSALVLLGMIFKIIPLHGAAPMSLIGLVLVVPFLLGIGAILGVSTVYFRDLINIVPVMIQALFFLTPIAFDRSMVPVRFHWVVDINPLYYFLELVRAPLLTGVLPHWQIYAIAAALAFATLALGVYCLRRCDSDIIFRL